MIRLKHLRVANFKALRDVELGFPEVGSILIEGLNESGKSTLFEAVYFALYGRPLVADIESTVRYTAKEAFVELAFMVDATEIVIDIDREFPIRRGVVERLGEQYLPDRSGCRLRSARTR